MTQKLIRLKKEKTKTSISIVFSLLVILSYFLRQHEDGDIPAVLVFGLINLFALSISLTFRSVMYFNKDNKQILTRFYLYGFVVYTQSLCLKEVRYLSIVPVMASSSITFMWSTKSFTEKSFNLNLIFPEGSKKRFSTVETGERKEMLRLGNLISENLNKPLCEIHGKEANWIKR